MSEKESNFYNKLRLLLIGIIGPFIVAGVVNAIIMIPNVKANTAAIGKFGEGYISRDEMMRYMETQREIQKALVKGYDDSRTLNIDEHRIMNQRMDELMREAYKINTRGGSKSSTAKK